MQKSLNLFHTLMKHMQLHKLFSTFNNALTNDKYPDEKVKIYNQASSKIKDLNPTNIASIESKNYEEDDKIPGENDEARKDTIAKEIEKLQKYTSEYRMLIQNLKI